MFDEGLDEQLQKWQRRQRRYLSHILISAVFFATVVWFFWGYRHALEYSFSKQSKPVVMGNVVERKPSDFMPNSYVSLEGITEHRGLSQKMVRGLSVTRQEFWYFRLLGSNGVFIEVPSDSSLYGLATAVKVEGRVVDPFETPQYGPLMNLYQDMFFPKQRTAIRIIQVGVVPGEGQGAFILVMFFLALLAGGNVFSIVRLVRERRSGPRGKLIQA